jgi:plasmid stabilization system protein ParE
VTGLRFDAAARTELLHEVAYYEATRPGTGRRFREAVEDALRRIEQTPDAGRPETEGCRRMRVTGFPFSIVYREERVEIVVYAVRPDAREPGYWLSRTR